MTDDLVKRLRIICAWKTPGGPMPLEEMIKPHVTCEEAANHIEKLEAALREVADCYTLPAQNDYSEMREIARKALEEKKDD